MSGHLGFRHFLFVSDAIGLARRELAAARTAFDAMRVARWAIGRAIDLCRGAEEALAVADLAGKSGPAFRALEAAALRAKDRFDTVRPFRPGGDGQRGVD